MCIFSQPSKVTVIIFVVPLSAFNQVLDESEFSFVLEMSRMTHRHHRYLREQTREFSIVLAVWGLTQAAVPAPVRFVPAMEVDM